MDIPPIGHVSISCGGIYKGPQSDVDATQDGPNAKGGDFDYEAYATYGCARDDIHVSLFVELLCGEGSSQEQHVKI